MSFAGMPNVPTSNITPDVFQMFIATKQNIEELTGQGSTEYAAILRGNITVSPVGTLNSTQPDVVGRAYSVSGATVPDYSDFINVLRTVQALVVDVESIRDRLDLLISQMSSSS